MKVTFRADASVQLGSGHVMRCLTLADALRQRGAEVSFLCRCQTGHLGDVIAARGYMVDWLPKDITATEDARLSRERLADGVDWLVVDHYGLDSTWEKALAPLTGSILAIDDLADRPHDCQVLLDQNWFTDPASRYAGLLPDDCRTLYGPTYALLRPEFFQLARHKPDRGQPPRRILVFLGGADPVNYTGRVLVVLNGYPELEVDVVAGHAHPSRAALAQWTANRLGSRLHSAGEGFAELLDKVDIAIGAGGTTTWERCCLGLPSLVLGIADNQFAVAEAVGEFGAHFYLGPADKMSDRELAAALDTLLAMPGLRRHLAERSQALVDGRGVVRLADLILPQSNLTLRAAEEADADLIFHWRNDPVTRRYFFDPRPLEVCVHATWYRDMLADPERILLIGENAGRAVGAIRYDIKDDTASISVFLDPSVHGKGYGVLMIRAGSHWLVAHRPGLHRLDAHIHPDNHASLAAFAAAGFTEHDRHYELVI